jgi:hypothetical protein
VVDKLCEKFGALFAKVFAAARRSDFRSDRVAANVARILSGELARRKWVKVQTDFASEMD